MSLRAQLLRNNHSANDFWALGWDELLPGLLTARSPMSIATRHTETPAADAARILVRLGLVVLFIALPCAAIVSNGAIYILLPVGAVVIIIGAMVGESGYGLRQLREALLSEAGLTALFLAFWAGLSLIWTPFSADASQRFLQTVITALLAAFAAACLPDRTKSFDLYLLPTGIALAALATLAAAFGHPVWLADRAEFDPALFERSVITLIVLVWPALGALSLRERWVLAAALALLAAAVALAGFAQMALAAMGAGALVFALAMSQPEKLSRRLALVFAPLILIAPALPLAYKLAAKLVGFAPGSLAATMRVWTQLGVGRWPRLITGHGFDAANHTLALGFLPPQAPRNLLFIIWYDLGLVGASAFALLCFYIFRLAGRAPPLVAPAILAGLVVILSLAILGVATTQIWWVTLINCDAMALVLLIKGVYRTERPHVMSIAAAPEAQASPE